MLFFSFFPVCHVQLCSPTPPHAGSPDTGELNIVGAPSGCWHPVLSDGTALGRCFECLIKERKKGESRLELSRALKEPLWYTLTSTGRQSSPRKYSLCASLVFFSRPEVRTAPAPHRPLGPELPSRRRKAHCTQTSRIKARLYPYSNYIFFFWASTLCLISSQLMLYKHF